MKVILVRSRAIDPAVNKVAETLSKNGYDVRLLVWDRQGTLKLNNNGNYLTNSFNFRAPYDKYSVLFFMPIWWIYLTYFLFKHECDIIHAFDLDTLFPAILAKIIRRIKLSYTIYDFYANNLPDGFLLFVRKLLRKIIASIEKFGIGFTDALFLVDECRYGDVKGARIKRIGYIYNSPPDIYENKSSLKLDASIVTVFYAGIIHESRGIGYLIRAIEAIDSIKLIIAGTGPYLDAIKNAEQNSSNIICLRQISYQEVIRRSLEADIVFAMYDPNIPSNRLASPNKLFEAMMCGKPIIINDGIAASDIVRKENCGLIVNYGSTDEIKDAICILRNNHQLRKNLGENGRKAYKKKYSWNIMEQRMLNIYKNI